MEESPLQEALTGWSVAVGVRQKRRKPVQGVLSKSLLRTVESTTPLISAHLRLVPPKAIVQSLNLPAPVGS